MILYPRKTRANLTSTEQFNKRLTLQFILVKIMLKSTSIVENYCNICDGFNTHQF